MKRRLNLVQLHFLTNFLKSRDKITFPEEYRPNRKEVKTISPYLKKSTEGIRNLCGGIDTFQKSVSHFSNILNSYVYQERQYNLEFSQKIEKVSLILSKFNEISGNLIKDIRRKYNPKVQTMKIEIEKSNILHEEFKYKLFNFENLDKSTESMKKKLKTLPAAQTHEYIRKIQKNIIQLEKQQNTLDVDFHKSNTAMKNTLHVRNTDHLKSLLDILLSFQNFFEEGVNEMEKYKEWINEEIEEIERAKEEYTPPVKGGNGGKLKRTWEILPFDPQRFLTTTMGQNNIKKEEEEEEEEEEEGEDDENEKIRKEENNGEEEEEEREEELGLGVHHERASSRIEVSDDIPKIPIGTVRAKYAFKPNEEGELEFFGGEKIFVLIRQNSEGWGLGINERGQLGEYPPNYVDPNMIPSQKTTAIYAYEAQEENELTFQKGQVITILHKEEDGWWIGCISDEETGSLEIGTFPRNYCEMGKNVKQ